MNDSQNSQQTQNDQIDVMLSKGVDALAINLVDPAAGQTVMEKIKAENVPVVFYNKKPAKSVIDAYDKAYYVGIVHSPYVWADSSALAPQSVHSCQWFLLSCFQFGS